MRTPFQRKKMVNKCNAWLVLFLLFLTPFTTAQESPFAAEEAGSVEEEFAEEIVLTEERAGTTPDSPLYVIDEIVEDANLALRTGESKAEYALGVKEEKISEAVLMVQKNNSEATAEALQKANNVSALIERELSPQLEALAKENTELSKKLLAAMQQNAPQDWEEVDQLIATQFTNEEKIRIASDLVVKIGDYCEELAFVDYGTMLQDTYCNPQNAPDWLREMIGGEIAKREEQAKEKVIEEITMCINDPRDCRCDDIPVENHRKECEENKALAIRCEFELDISACEELEQKPFVPEGLPAFLRPAFESTMAELIAKKEKEMFEKFAPAECKEAGVSTRGECETIMREKYGEPPEECQREGKFIGEEACMQIMIEKHDIPSECIKDGKLIGREACEEILVSKGIIPQECVEGGKFIGREACEEKMVASGTIPPECAEGGKLLSEDECIARLVSSGKIPEQCVENGEFVGREKCEERMRSGAGGQIGGPGTGEAPAECIENGQFIGEEACIKKITDKFTAPGAGEGVPGIPGSVPIHEGAPEAPAGGVPGIVPALPEIPAEIPGEQAPAQPGEITVPPVIPNVDVPPASYQPGADQHLIVDAEGAELVDKDELRKVAEEAERRAHEEGEHEEVERIRGEIEQIHEEREQLETGAQGESQQPEEPEEAVEEHVTIEAPVEEEESVEVVGEAPENEEATVETGKETVE